MITLRFCTFARTDYGCWTQFHDGTGFGAYPHPDNHHYHAISHRLGYGDDLLSYAVQHEFSHNFVSERLMGKPSAVIWALAHGEKLSGREAAYEEIAAQAFQRFIQANERPLVAGVPWDALKADALSLLAELG